MLNDISKTLFGLRNRHFFIIDAIAFLITPVLALALRLDQLFIFNVFHTYGLELILVTILYFSSKTERTLWAGFL